MTDRHLEDCLLGIARDVAAGRPELAAILTGLTMINTARGDQGQVFYDVKDMINDLMARPAPAGNGPNHDVRGA